jgi:hypothetical protein
MSITFTQTPDTVAGLFSTTKIIQADWTTGAGQHAVSDTLTLAGLLYGIASKPGSPTPSDGYGITLTNPAGLDVLQGRGAGRSGSTVQWVESCVSDSLPTPISGAHVLKLSDVGSDTAGTAWLLVRR